MKLELTDPLKTIFTEQWAGVITTYHWFPRHKGPATKHTAPLSLGVVCVKELLRTQLKRRLIAS